MRFFSLILATLLLVSFSNDKETNVDPIIEKIVGNYAVVSFTSNIAVDLNNDDTVSTDLKNQIRNFNSHDLTIRPNPFYLNDIPFISFSIPKTYIEFGSPSFPDGYSAFAKYRFSTYYTVQNNEIILEESSYIEYVYRKRARQ
jgi:hypothetical protein